MEAGASLSHAQRKIKNKLKKKNPLWFSLECVLMCWLNFPGQQREVRGRGGPLWWLRLDCYEPLCNVESPTDKTVLPRLCETGGRRDGSSEGANWEPETEQPPEASCNLKCSVPERAKEQYSWLF